MQSYKDSEYLRSFGRIKSRTLSNNKLELINDFLPQISVPNESIASLNHIFAKNYPEYHLEIGFGAGEHLIHKSTTNPDIGFIGAEAYINGMASCLNQIKLQNIENIRLFNDDARILLSNLPSNSISKIYILFSDPWPKKSHHNRRLINQYLLNALSRIITPNGQLVIATDDEDYASHILHHINFNENFLWNANKKADWQTKPDDWFITRYQQRAIRLNHNIYYITANSI